MRPGNTVCGGGNWTCGSQAGCRGHFAGGFDLSCARTRTGCAATGTHWGRKVLVDGNQLLQAVYLH
jgi:hypothetical protein